MRKLLPYICIAFAVFLLSVSCGERAGVIPRGKMARIYADMFLADEWVGSDRDARRAADTSLVYEAVFERYGYTSDDYRKSVEHYIADPDRYARILRETAVLIENDIKVLKKEREILRSISARKEASDVFRPERIFALSGIGNKDLLTVDSVAFFIDSTGGDLFFDVQKGYDTLFAGPRVEILRDSSTIGITAADSVSQSATIRTRFQPAAVVGEVRDAFVPGKGKSPAVEENSLKR